MRCQNYNCVQETSDWLYLIVIGLWTPGDKSGFRTRWQLSIWIRYICCYYSYFFIVVVVVVVYTSPRTCSSELRLFHSIPCFVPVSGIRIFYSVSTVAWCRKILTCCKWQSTAASIAAKQSQGSGIHLLECLQRCTRDRDCALQRLITVRPCMLAEVAYRFLFYFILFYLFILFFCRGETIANSIAICSLL